MNKSARFITKDLIGRGALLSHGRWYLGDERYGFIETTPDQLRASASLTAGFPVSNDQYALARMIRSEGAKEGVVRAHVAMNDLETFPYAQNLFDLLTYSTDKARRGFFGKQYSPPFGKYLSANRRRYSTARDPYETDLQTAMLALAERSRGIDRVKGATKFIDKSDMGAQLGSVSFAQKDAEWRGDGYQPFSLPEFGNDLVLYRKV